MAIDPVCGMSVDEQTVADSTSHEGTRYYFCSTGELDLCAKHGFLMSLIM
ncbi:MAG: YHS domain-containing protein [Gammaproteobacteria bacterium]|nr:YHS domain-containing protein [Gammaproteobacteria bacterium]